jgi:hypothetical protein
MGVHGFCETRQSPRMVRSCWRFLSCPRLRSFGPKYQLYLYRSVTGSFPCIYAAPGPQNAVKGRIRLPISFPAAVGCAVNTDFARPSHDDFMRCYNGHRGF